MRAAMTLLFQDAFRRCTAGPEPFPESHAAAVKHDVTKIEKMMGIIKKYFQLKTVMPAKQTAKVHAVPRISAKDSGGNPPSCQANNTASSRNTLTKSPNPT